MRRKWHKKFNWIGDWSLVIVLSVIDLGLIAVAKNYFDSLNDLASRSVAAVSPDIESQAMEDLKRIAEKGSWEEFEDARAEKAAHYLQSSLQPSAGNALYFFPETLPSQSLENDFVSNQIKPGLNALKTAYKQKQKDDAEKAFRVLKSRIENYELGASQSSESLSKEAKEFLDLYALFSKKLQH